MDAEDGKAGSLLTRKTTRRVVVGTSLAAASVAAAYAALGDKLELFGGHSGSTTSAYKDTDAIKSESVKISHLLRRTGFGLTREEYDRYQGMGLSNVIDELVHYTNVNDDDAVAAANQVTGGQGRNNPANLQAWWLVRMANTKRPLQEKMTFFWHGLLTSQLSVVRDNEGMAVQNEFFRQNAMADISEILRGVSMDPAMMVYLDVNGSQRQAPNENYARELMELFSLGVGNYSEQDIREAARAFTGWTVPRNAIAPNVSSFGEPVFRPERFDGGSKTFLGRTGNFRIEDIVDIIVQQPAHAKFITGKLFAFFVHPNPNDAELQPFIDVYVKSNRNIGAVVEAILRSDVMYAPQAYRSMVKSPVEYAIGAVKALGGAGAAAQVFGQGRAATTTNMGQTLFEPPNVAGWPGGSTWLNSATMFARLNFINGITNPEKGRPAQAGSLPDNLGTVSQALDYFLPVVLDSNLPAEARKVMADYAGGADAVITPEQLKGLAYLVLASPQFHLA